MKLDILVIAAHPDDAELGCGGTIIRHVEAGYKVGIVDLTRGELGTRGTVESREREAADAASIMGVSVRINLGFQDGFFANDREHQISVAAAIRKFQPDIVLANAITDRHPDHGRSAELAKSAAFLAGLAKIVLHDNDGNVLEAWRPKTVYHYIQSNFIQPHFVVDVTAQWEKKMQAIKAFKTQFYDPASREPETFISRPGFLDFLQARAMELGHSIGVRYGEGFTVLRYPGVSNLFDLS